MKKVLMLLIMFLITLGSYAQSVDKTFRFVDEAGKEYPDGSVLDLDRLELIVLDSLTNWGIWQVPAGLYIENTTNSAQGVKLTLNITSITPKTSVQFCLLNQCNAYAEVGSYVKAGTEAAYKKDGLMLEWMPDIITDENTGVDTPLAGSASATLTAEVTNADGSVKTKGPTITLNFSYDGSPTGIENNVADGTSKQVKAIYDANGAVLSTLRKGLNIVKYTDGTTKKVLK